MTTAASSAPSGALFEPDGDTFVPTSLARGPWSPDALHGGPVAALLARAFESHEVDAGTVLVRLSVELLRPVPLAPLTLAVRTERAGRRVQTLGAVLRSGDTELALARAVRLASVPVELPPVLPPAPVRPLRPPAAGSRYVDDTWEYEAFHNTGTEMRFVDGSFEEDGPAAVWIRLTVPVVGGEEPSGPQRAAAAADFGNGVSRAVPFEGWLFVNADLTVSLVRPPEGEWIGLDAVTHVSGHGAGLAESALHDDAGALGRAVQSLVIARR